MDTVNINASKGSKFLIIFIVLATVFVVFLSFFEYFIKRDFILYIKEICNPITEKCFLHQCEDGDVRCSSFPDGKFYYKIIYQKQYKIPACTGTNCPPVTCGTGDTTCSVYYCSDKNLNKFGLSDTCSS